MTGPEFKRARERISRLIGERLTIADMAALCGLTDPAGNGADTVRKWESGPGPSGPVAVHIEFVLEGLDHTKDPAVH
ncbi:hypothetical protein ACPXBI_28330, partial [Escherichia coli]|uniref:hypothetical protein n=1 Tax=Escherichia coli TaxID=562 RepID=UPI003CE479BF